MNLALSLAGAVLFAIAAPAIGCLLAGADRKISARMQGRVGPPILQPYYDVAKLLKKKKVSVNGAEGAYVNGALGFAVLAGVIFFAGGDLLLSIFMITLSELLFILAAYSSRSPYAEVGGMREILQVLAYEPAVLLVAVVFYLVTGTTLVGEVAASSTPVVVYGWPILGALLFVLTIKLRKSPFDLSMSHHAHQEIVRGITVEMSGPTLAKIEIMHWYETVLFLGWVGLFFMWDSPLSVLVAVFAVILIYGLEIVIDNNSARLKWQNMVVSAWVVALVAGGVNVAALMAF